VLSIEACRCSTYSSNVSGAPLQCIEVHAAAAVRKLLATTCLTAAIQLATANFSHASTTHMQTCSMMCCVWCVLTSCMSLPCCSSVSHDDLELLSPFSLIDAALLPLPLPAACAAAVWLLCDRHTGNRVVATVSAMHQQLAQ
jgi:hypothetical protein